MKMKSKRSRISQLTLLGLFAFCTTQGQATLNSSGADQVISTGAHSYSIGEMTLVSTDHSPNLVVTQGVLQPNRNSTNAPSALDEKELASQITVYPNPTSDILYIKTKSLPHQVN